MTEMVEFQPLGAGKLEMAEPAASMETHKAVPTAPATSMETIEEVPVASAELGGADPTQVTQDATAQETNLRVYFRKKKNLKGIDPSTTPMQGHESNQTPENGNQPGNPIPNSDSDRITQELTELDVPIALRKGVRTCTQHPIEKYVIWKIITGVQDICGIP